MNKQWFWRIVIIVLAVAFVPIFVSGVSAILENIIQSIGNGVHEVLRPFSQSGTVRLRGIIQFCLYLISIGLLARIIIRK
jgi:hypothetical protein